MSPMIEVTILERHPCSCTWPESCNGTEERRCQSEGCQCGCGHSRPCEGCAECPIFDGGCLCGYGCPSGQGCRHIDVPEESESQ